MGTRHNQFGFGMTLLLLGTSFAASACASSGASTQGRLRSGEWHVHLPSTSNPVQDMVQGSNLPPERTTSLADLDAVVSDSAKRASETSAK